MPPVAAVVLVGLARPRADLLVDATAPATWSLSDRREARRVLRRAYPVPQAESYPRRRGPFTESRTRALRRDDQRYARLNGVRTDLVRAVVQVSQASTRWAKSPKGAMGLMQLMPATIRSSASEIRSTRSRTSAPAWPICGSCSIGTRTTRCSRSPPTTPAPAQSTGTARPSPLQGNPGLRLEGQQDRRRPRSAGLPATPIYRITEVVDGRETVRYSDRKPATGTYELMAP